MRHMKPFRLVAVIGLIAAACPFAFGQDFPESSRRLCFGDYAFCSAAVCTPTGGQIVVNTATGTASFPAATCVCPILKGVDEVEVAGGNMLGSCEAPDHKSVWSGFWPHLSTPQQLSNWQTAPAPGLLCGSDLNQGNQSVNCYSFKCEKAGTMNGVEVANCTCPIGETFDGTAIPAATAFFTQAGQCDVSICSQHPVSDPVGFDDVTQGGQCFRFPQSIQDELSSNPVWDNLTARSPEGLQKNTSSSPASNGESKDTDSSTSSRSSGKAKNPSSGTSATSNGGAKSSSSGANSPSGR
jgi:hypothetical protein